MNQQAERRAERRRAALRRQRGEVGSANLLARELQQKRATPAEEALIMARYRQLLATPSLMSEMGRKSAIPILAKEFQRNDRTIKKCLDRERAREKEHAKAKMLITISQGLGIDYTTPAAEAIEVLLGALHGYSKPDQSARWAAGRILDGIDRAAKKLPPPSPDDEMKDDDIPQ